MMYMLYTRHRQFESKRMEKNISCNSNRQSTEMTIVFLGKEDFKAKKYCQSKRKLLQNDKRVGEET